MGIPGANGRLGDTCLKGSERGVQPKEAAGNSQRQRLFIYSTTLVSLTSSSSPTGSALIG